MEIPNISRQAAKGLEELFLTILRPRLQNAFQAREIAHQLVKELDQRDWFIDHADFRRDREYEIIEFDSDLDDDICDDVRPWSANEA